jgi:hypothetical protein
MRSRWQWELDPQASPAGSPWRGFPSTGVRESRNPRASPGGTPEPKDASRHATLAREALEENQVRIAATTAYLGYQQVLQPGHPPYAQVRMAGIITEFAPRAPRPRRRQRGALPASHDLTDRGLGWGELSPIRTRYAPHRRS